MKIQMKPLTAFLFGTAVGVGTLAAIEGAIFFWWLGQ